MGNKWRFHGEMWPYTAYVSTYGKLSSSADIVQRTGAQAIWSEGRPHHLIGVGVRDIGGKFESHKIDYELGEPRPFSLRDLRTTLGTSGWRREYFTVLYPSAEVKHFANVCKDGFYGKEGADPQARQGIVSNTPAIYSDANLDSWGSTAVSRVLPTAPHVDLSTALGELIRERKFFSTPGTDGTIAGEYLNYVFGIAPVIDDGLKLRKAIEDAEKLLQQFERDSGRLVRRRYAPPPSIETTKVVTAGVYPYADTAVSLYVVELGTRTTITKTTVSKWFSGAFTYHLPPDGWRRSLAELDHLYGIKPGVDSLWNLIPYSWLADYFLNIGDVLKNVNALSSDGLVMPYGYVMHETRVEHDHSWVGRVRIDGDWTQVVLTAKVVETTQQRRQANPFGFGITFDGLSIKQLSILGALGISRVS